MTTHNKTPDKVEVVTFVERRRRWSTAEKLEIVEEAELTESSVSAVARKHGISPSQLFHWRRLAREGQVFSFFGFL